MPDRDLVAGRSVCRSCAKGGRGVVARPGVGAVKSGLQVRIPFAVGVGVDHRPRFLDRLEPLVSLVHVVTVARFAAQREGDDAGVVARAVVHRLDPFEVFVGQRGIVRRRAAHTAVVAPVGSVDVGPVDDVKTEFVAKFVEPRRLRIVGADGVAALGFEVFQLREGGFTVCGGVVAGFDEFDLLVEAGDAAVGEFGLAEADLQRHVFAVSPVAA